MKVCNKCGLSKDESEFNKNKAKSDGLQARCKLCNSNYLKIHYVDNKDIYKKHRKIRKDRTLTWLSELKSILKCSRCPEDEIVCLDFHHIDAKEKEYNISYMANTSFSKDMILKEIDKCIILCANCHRKEHLLGRGEVA